MDRESPRTAGEADAAAPRTAARQLPGEAPNKPPERTVGPASSGPSRRRAAPKRTSKVAPVSSLDEPLEAPPRMKAGLKKLGITTYHDALWAFPRRYLPVARISELRLGEQSAVAVQVERAAGGATHQAVSCSVLRRRSPMIRRTCPSSGLGIRGLAGSSSRAPAFCSPAGLRSTGDELSSRWTRTRSCAQAITSALGDLVPMYPLTKGVTQSGMRRLIGPRR